MKKFLALLLAIMMVLTLTACGSKTEEPTAGGNESDVTEITLWTYPIGGWGNQDTVNELIKGFEAANEGIKVTVEYLDYTNGDDQVNTAIEGNQAPDLIMEGPERLVANWGDKGLMVDLSDIVTDTDKDEIYPQILTACTHKSGAVY